MTDKVATFQLTVKRTDDGREVFIHAAARMVSASLAPTLDQTFIKNLLDTNDCGKFERDDDAIDELVTALADTLAQITTEEDAEGVEFDTNSIATAVDARADIEVSSDKMTATLKITPAKGGEDLTLDSAKAVLDEAGVTYGIDEKRINQLLEQAKVTTEDSVEDQVAFGLEPVDGEDAQFIPLVPTANERILKPRVREDGTVDMHDLGDLPTVKEGTHLMRKEPPTDGEKGIDVSWEFVAPKKGIDKTLKPGSGTRISDEDQNLLIAAISGQPNLLDNTMKVDDAVQVKAVDLQTGNMILDANLIVKGDIGEGMKVESEGDITVGGVIESAQVKARGNIIVGKGIIGRPHSDKGADYTAHVQADGDISAMFASYAKLRTKKDLHIAEQLLHCDTYVEGEITVGNEKTVGSQIVGGITRASEGIKVDILGTSAGVATSLDLSGRLLLKQMEISCNHSIIAGREKVTQTMIDALSKFSTLPSTPARQEHIAKIKNTITHLKDQLEKSSALDEQLKQELKELCQGVQVKVKKKIQPNVSLRVGHHVFKTSRERESGQLYFKDDEIKYRPANESD